MHSANAALAGLTGLADARRVVGAAAARGFKAPRRRSVKDWAHEERVVAAESGSPFPGRWSSATPYLDEIMEVLSPADKSRRVVFKASAQVGKSETGLNLIGWCIETDPAAMLVVLPTTDEVTKWIDIKLQPMIDATPGLRTRVSETKSRDEDGSTKRRKKFPGGFVQVTHASASSGLQMVTAKFLLLEEPSEYPEDVDGRGDPIALAERRTEMWEGKQKIYLSGTPALAETCRVSSRYEASDQRRFFTRCPHCGTFQVLLWERMIKTAVEAAAYPCAACGVLLTDSDKPRMLRGGVWLKCYPGDDAPPLVVSEADLPRHHARPSAGREPGFHLWAAYSPKKSFGAIVRDFLAIRSPGDEKSFTNQVLGEAYAPKLDAPAEDRIAEAADKAGRHRLRVVPPDGLILCAAADVQGDRIEWAVWAFDEEARCWDVDRGVISGDPAEAQTWTALDALLDRSYVSADGRRFGIDGLGVDTGYETQAVYRWARRWAHAGKVWALKGQAGWMHPALGSPKRMDVDFAGKKIGEVELFPVGTWPLKAELYSGLQKLQAGRSESGRWPAGTVFLSDEAGREVIAQLTAEHVAETRTRYGALVREWRRIKGRANEQHDLAIYARALYRHLTGRLEPGEWARLIADRRRPVIAQEELFVRGLHPGAAPETPAASSGAGDPAPPGSHPLPPQPAAVGPELTQEEERPVADDAAGFFGQTETEWF